MSQPPCKIDPYTTHEKRCAKCLQWKPLKEFLPRSKGLYWNKPLLKTCIQCSIHYKSAQRARRESEKIAQEQ
jgi:hypothetical protein